MQNVHHTLRLNAPLLKVAQKVRAEEIESEKTKKDKPHWQSKTLSDEQVLQIRALKEFAGWKPSKIANSLKLDLDRVYKIVTYEQRSKLIPKRSDLPKL